MSDAYNKCYIHITDISVRIHNASNHESYAPGALVPKRLMCTGKQKSDLHMLGERRVYVYARYVSAEHICVLRRSAVRHVCVCMYM